MSAASDDEPEQPDAVVCRPSENFQPAVLVGKWKCVHTWGMEEFLKASGVDMWSRKFALAAKWPSWEFHQKDGAILFINHTAIGDLKEEIDFDKPYNFIDGKK